MKNKIECLITSILIVLSFVFITWSIGFIIPRYWVTIAFLVYGIYLIYGILNPKKKYYFASYWLPGGERGRIFIACDEFKVREMEESIAKDKRVEMRSLTITDRFPRRNIKFKKINKYEQD